MEKLNEKNILFLSANADGVNEKRLTQEFKVIEKALKQRKIKPKINLIPGFNITEDEFSCYLFENSPWILHFAGHGFESGDSGAIMLESSRESGKGIVYGCLLAKHIEDCPSIKGVFFNSCFSGALLEVLGPHVEYFIGIGTEISDENAIELSVFYSCFIDNRSVSFAMLMLKKSLQH